MELSAWFRRNVLDLEREGIQCWCMGCGERWRIQNAAHENSMCAGSGVIFGLHWSDTRRHPKGPCSSAPSTLGWSEAGLFPYIPSYHIVDTAWRMTVTSVQQLGLLPFLQCSSPKPSPHLRAQDTQFLVIRSMCIMSIAAESKRQQRYLIRSGTSCSRLRGPLRMQVFKISTTTPVFLSCQAPMAIPRFRIQPLSYLQQFGDKPWNGRENNTTYANKQASRFGARSSVKSQPITAR